MKVEKKDLKNCVKVKTFNWCMSALRNVNGCNYNALMRLVDYLTSEDNANGIAYDICIQVQTDSSKYVLFCEKEQKIEISKLVKDYWTD